MVRHPDPRVLVAQFARDVAQQTDAIMRGDHKTGNKHAKRYIRAFGKLGHSETSAGRLSVSSWRTIDPMFG